MAKVLLIGLDPSVTRQIGNALSDGSHQIEQRSITASARDIRNADIVFASGENKKYIPLLQDIRRQQPALPFVVVTRIPETSDWLDALEAGATDYCSAPFEPRQISWLVQSALGSLGRVQMAVA